MNKSAVQLTPATAELGKQFVEQLIVDGLDYETATRKFQQLLVVCALEKTNGQKIAAARMLKMSRNHVRMVARKEANPA